MLRLPSRNSLCFPRFQRVEVKGKRVTWKYGDSGAVARASAILTEGVWVAGRMQQEIKLAQEEKPAKLGSEKGLRNHRQVQRFQKRMLFFRSGHTRSFRTLDLYHSSASWRFLAATLSYCWRTSRRAAVRSGLETSISIWTCCSWIWACSSWISWGKKREKVSRAKYRGGQLHPQWFTHCDSSYLIM